MKTVSITGTAQIPDDDMKPLSTQLQEWQSGAIHLPPGVFDVDGFQGPSPLFKSGMRIVGAGSGRTIIRARDQQSAGQWAVIWGGTLDGFGLEGVSLEWSGAIDPARKDVDRRGVFVKGTNIVIRDVDMSGLFGSLVGPQHESFGINIGSGIIDGCRVSGISGTSATAFLIENGTVRDCECGFPTNGQNELFYGYTMANAGQVRFERCRSVGGRSAGWIDTGTFQSALYTDCSFSGASAVFNSNTSSPQGAVEFDNCRFESCNNGILFSNGSVESITIRDCVLTGDTAHHLIHSPNRVKVVTMVGRYGPVRMRFDGAFVTMK